MNQSQSRTADKPRRVVRGGGWLNYPFRLRSAFRDWSTADDAGYDLGFRPLQKTNTNGPNVLRGGSWDYNQGFVRSTSRYGSVPLNRFSSFGFRVLSEIR